MALARICFLFITVAVAAAAAAAAGTDPLSLLDYTCDGGNTYKLSFTKVTGYNSYFITDGKAPSQGPIYSGTPTSCSVPIQTMTGATANVTLQNCTNNPFVYLMNSLPGAPTKAVGGKSFLEYELQCQIPSIGITVNVDGVVGVTVQPTPTEKSLNPSVDLIMKITDKNNTMKTTFMLGETLILDIHDNSAAGHDLKLLTCDASSSSGTSADTVPIYSGPSTVKNEVFEKLTTSNTDLFVELHAFRFVSSETVNMKCIVKVCNKGDTKCMSNRRRRAADSPDLITAVDGSFTIVQRDSDKPTASGQATVLPWCASIISMVAVAISIFMKK